jgi:hypothetical protein
MLLRSLGPRVNRTQALVLGFFLLAVTSLVVILAAAPEVYDQALRLAGRNKGGDRPPRGTDWLPHTAGHRRPAAMALDVLADSGRLPCPVLRVPVADLQLTGPEGRWPTLRWLSRTALGFRPPHRLRIWRCGHGGAGRCRTLRFRSRPDMQAAVDGSAADCPAGPLPQRPRVPPPQPHGCPQCRPPAGCRCPQAASAVAVWTSMAAGHADLARNPGASTEPDTVAAAAGRPGLPPGAGRTATLCCGHGRGSPEQGR